MELLRKGNRRKQHILDIASSLIRRRGFEALSVSDIAREAGISVGGLYRHFSTKTDLLVLACENINAESQAAIEVAIASGTTVTAKLEGAIREYWAYCHAHADLIHLTYVEFRSLPAEAQKRFRDRESAIADLLRDVIRAGMLVGEFRPVDDRVMATEIIFLSHMTAFKRWALRPADPAVVSEEHVQLFLSRLRK